MTFKIYTNNDGYKGVKNEDDEIILTARFNSIKFYDEYIYCKDYAYVSLFDYQGKLIAYGDDVKPTKKPNIFLVRRGYPNSKLHLYSLYRGYSTVNPISTYGYTDFIFKEDHIICSRDWFANKRKTEIFNYDTKTKEVSKLTCFDGPNSLYVLDVDTDVYNGIICCLVCNSEATSAKGNLGVATVDNGQLNLKISAKHDSINYFANTPYLAICKNNRWGVYTIDGESILPVKYKNVDMTEIKGIDFFELETYAFTTEYYDISARKLITAEDELQKYIADKKYQQYHDVNYLEQAISSYLKSHSLKTLQTQFNKIVQEYRQKRNLVFNQEQNFADNNEINLTLGTPTKKESSVLYENYLLQLQRTYDKLPRLTTIFKLIEKLEYCITSLQSKNGFSKSSNDPLINDIKKFYIIAEHIGNIKYDDILKLVTLLSQEKQSLNNLVNNCLMNDEILSFTEENWLLNFRMKFYPLLQTLRDNLSDYKLNLLVNSSNQVKDRVEANKFKQAAVIVAGNQKLIQEIKDLISYFYASGYDFTEEINQLNSLAQQNVVNKKLPYNQNIVILESISNNLAELYASLNLQLTPYKKLYESEEVKKVA